MENPKKISQKWGFGMAPISDSMRGRYEYAAESMLRCLVDDYDIEPEYISELKGMFNRCVRKDQWDWFSVHSRFGFLPLPMMRGIANQLDTTRRALVAADKEAFSRAKEVLKNLELTKILNKFLEEETKGVIDGAAGWIYILSTREQPDVLKIGMTRRSVVERVKEINSATGVLFPFSARQIFRVKDAPKAEREIFDLLAEYRVRKDREFFVMKFYDAVKSIQGILYPKKN